MSQVTVNQAPVSHASVSRSAAKPVAIRAVQPSAALEAWYRAKLREMIETMAASMLTHIRAAWRQNEPDIGFARDDSPIVSLRRAMQKWGAKQIDRFDAMALEIAKAFADKSRRDFDSRFQRILKKAGWTVKFKPTAASVDAYRAVLAENVNLIKSIPQQYLKDVETQVWQSVMKGGKLSDLTQGIHQKYGVAWRRAAFIARDQNNKAKAVMENVRRQELGITEAIWLHSHAGKEPRPTHVAMHGKRFALKDGMYDSDVGEYVWPGTLPNCRCVSKSILPGL